MRSEFGKGQCYNLGLFLAHAERINSDLKSYKNIGDGIRAYSMWFYGAADHLYHLDCDVGSPYLKRRLSSFRSKVMTWRLPMCESDYATKEDYVWAINEAKTLLRLIDKHHGVKTIKGDWE